MNRTFCDKCNIESKLNQIEVYIGKYEWDKITRNFCKTCYNKNKKLIKHIMEEKNENDF